VIQSSRLLFVPLCLLLWSCFEQGDCQNQTSNLIKVSFFSSSDLKSKKLQLDSVLITGLDGKFIEDKELDGLVLPLNPLSSETEVILYQPGTVSVLRIGYQARTTVLDPACGATDLFNLKNISGEGFSSATIIEDLVTINLTNNVSVYF